MRIYKLLVILFLVSCAGNNAVSGQTKEISMVARNYDFEPQEVVVNKGDTVVLHVYGEDDGSGQGHGISIPAFGVNEVIREGQNATVEFVADKAGRFPFFCSVFCGHGHGEMKGTLIVR